MDSEALASLSDNKDAIDERISEVESKIKEYEIKTDNSAKNKIKNDIVSYLHDIEDIISSMKSDWASLEENKNKNEWEQEIADLTKKKEDLEKRISKGKIIVKVPNMTEEEIQLGMSQKNKTMQQAFDLGDNILNKDELAIKKMVQQTHKGLETMKESNKELLRQSEKLDESEKNLKDMDVTLANAANQLKQLFSIYASDKIIMGLVILVVLAILAVIIISFIKKNDTDSNKPSDVFK